MVRPSIALIGAAALALVIGGCEKQAKSDPDAAKNAIKADEKRWNQEFQAKDVEAAMSHYADDAFLVAPGVKGTDGSTEIRLSV
jgi:ketosteroid isomerase-like protein